MPLSEAAGPSIPGEFLIKYKPARTTAVPSLQSTARALQSHVVKTFRRSGWQLVRLPNPLSAKEGVAYLRSFPDIAWVEPNYRIEMCSTPNEPDFSKLWGLEKIGVPEAWKDTTGTTNVVVAIMDSGIDYTHPDLAANIWRNPGEIPGNGKDDDRNGYIDDVFGIDLRETDSDPMDDIGHGSHVAGTVGAVGGNGVGVVGVNWSVRLMALRIFSADGASSATDDAVEAYEYAIAMKQRGINVRVMNNSWVSRAPSAARREVIGVAAKEGILSVCGAGNDYQNNDWTPAYPAGYDLDGVVSVAASNQGDLPASFSNFGRLTVHLAAPGVATLSTYKGGPYYAEFNGTSMATPHVSGAAALLLSKRPTLTPAELKSILLSSVDRLPVWEDKLISGGRLNVAKAMQQLAAMSPSGSVQPPSNTTATPSEPAAQDSGYRRLTLVSRNRRGQLGNASSAFSSISADGRFVAFASDATNLVDNDTNERSDAFLLDRQSGSVERISVSDTGEQAKDDSDAPAISGDGRYVVFASSANNLVPGDRNREKDIFVFDRVGRRIELVSVLGAATPANGPSESPSISADGRFIAFASDASNLTRGDTNFVRDIFVRDRLEGTTTSLTGPAANDESDSPSISADGRVVAFDSLASNLIPGDTNDSNDVFVFDRETQRLERVSVTSSGVQADVGSAFATVSGDGRYVAFQSFAENLGPPDANSALDIFVRDRQAKLTRRISRSNTGVEPDSDCTNPVISADGRFLVFMSDATNLTPGDAFGVLGLFLFDQLTAKLTRLTVSDAGFSAAAGSLVASLSADGRCIAFSSLAYNLVPADGNAAFDIFLLDRGEAQPDLMLKASGRTGSFAGRGVYGAISDQRVEQTITSGQTAIYEIQVENSGQVAATFAISAGGSPKGWKAEFHDSASGGSAITSSVVSTGWSTPVVEPGKSLTFRLEVSLANPKEAERSAPLVVRVRSSKTPSQEDAVQTVTLLPFAPPDLLVASRTAAGSPGNDSSDFASMSGDGSLVAFSSEASNLAADDFNGVAGIYVFDRRAQRSQMISQTSRSGPGDGPSRYPAISRDGRYVAFQSLASNLIVRDVNSAEDIFLKDRVSGSIRLVSVGLGGALANHASEFAAISGAGERVAFRSFATNLVLGDTNRSWDVFLFDRITSALRCVSLADNGEFGNGDSDWPVITPDGKWVAFASFASNFSPADTNGYEDVFLYDVDNRKIELVSRTPQGRSPNGSSGSPSLSDDARFLAFTSTATDLTPGGSSSGAYLYDRTNRQLTPLQVAIPGKSGPVRVFAPVVSPDGQWIAFSTPDIAPSGGTDGTGQVFLQDRTTGRVLPVSASRTGTLGLDHSHGASFSADGRFVAFASWAQNLIGENLAPLSHVLVLDRGSFQPDALVRREGPGAYRGDQIYDVSGQTFETILAASDAATFYIAIHNRGNFPDSIVVSAASGSVVPVNVEVFEVEPASNVTPQITGGGWNTGLLMPGAKKELKVVLRPSASPEASPVVRITLASVNDPSKSDQFELVLKPDSDADGLPDDWEKRYFGGLGVGTKVSDSDGDGLIDRLEYAAGTDPKNSDSRLAIRRVSLAGQSQLAIAWASESNRFYSVEHSRTVGGPYMPVVKDLPGTPPENVIVLPNPGVEGYLRVRAELP